MIYCYSRIEKSQFTKPTDDKPRQIFTKRAMKKRYITFKTFTARVFLFKHLFNFFGMEDFLQGRCLKYIDLAFLFFPHTTYYPLFNW